ncbi:hypothetical protein Srubr_38970 [Streptomyces rubradiris]|uniref:Uncharacterized protein n=1 Tax=Streptomyces rubradiris TaxID=285531 RepID=A0ABQ3RDW8_STRRR|nr:hypothetical protein GCM10018792_71730 [Streptomyces rubradiris]GHI54051.1 hypothetical protein Srubr_38970 [Streptomyces rubradiris]
MWCKGLDQPYLPRKRAWIKVRARVTTEALTGGVTGSLTAPLTLLLARYDALDGLRPVPRTTPLAAGVGGSWPSIRRRPHRITHGPTAVSLPAGGHTQS